MTPLTFTPASERRLTFHDCMISDPLVRIVRAKKEEFMEYSELLNLLVSVFEGSAKTNPDFKKFLMGHECSIVIKTKDGRQGKRFIFQGGNFSADDVLDDYDAAMIWSDAQTAFDGLKDGEEGIKRSLSNHFVSIDGKVHDFTWFGAVLKFCMG